MTIWNIIRDVLVLGSLISSVLVRSITVTTRKYELLTPFNVKYVDFIGLYRNISTIKCLAFCDIDDNCSSVNYDVDKRLCELTSHHPNDVSPGTTTEMNWRVYFNDVGTGLIPAVDAWQRSTYVHMSVPLVATLAIDGNRDNILHNTGASCAHTATGFSYWAMEFEYVAIVDHVVIYFRNDDVNNDDRNRSLQLRISMTRDDSDNNIGILCTSYGGPPETSALPVTIKCTEPTKGKFLKIRHFRGSSLILCEVEVYSI